MELPTPIPDHLYAVTIQPEMHIDKICRTCLTKRNDLLNLFQENIDKKLMECTTVHVQKGDGLPHQICPPCRDEINKALVFKEITKSSDETLRKYVSLQSNNHDKDQSDCESTHDVEIAGDMDEEDSQKTLSDYIEELPHNPTSNSHFITLTDHMDPINRVGTPTIDDIKTDLTPTVTVETAISCKICNETFPGKSSLNKHQRDKHKKKKEVKHRSCNYCNKTFPLKISLSTHLRTHGFGEKKHVCEHCGRKFFEPNDLRVHIRKHTGERPLICQVCGKSFADPRSLLKHNKIHIGEKKHECDVCHKRFLHSYTLTAHRRTHTGEKPFVCSICGHTYATSTQLTIHVRSHTKEKPYKCKQCTKSFTSRSGLSAHELTHTGERKHKCPMCGKGARTTSDLSSHMRTHTGEKPYKCKMGGCTKMYKTSSQLASHTRSHTGEKRHVCDKCGRAFADTTQLKSHLNIHTGEKPFVCEECGSRFTHSGSLYSHMKSHKKRREKEAALQQVV